MFQESVQRLFQQAVKPKDEFTQWCENALRGMQSSVDGKQPFIPGLIFITSSLFKLTLFPLLSIESAVLFFSYSEQEIRSFNP